MPHLKVQMAGISMDSPLVLASGVLGVTASSMRRVVDHGAGAVTTKSCSIHPRKGHPGPCIIPYEHGMINAVGLSNPGVDAVVNEIRTYRAECQAPIFASVFAGSVEEFGKVTRRIAAGNPDLIEVNVSCPNVQSEFGAPFGASFEDTAAITRIVKKNAGKIPVAMKLTVHCPSIGKMAKVCEDNGADVITAINTVGPGMLIDVGVKRPILSNKMGGVSGAGIFPVALKAVWEIHRNCNLPILATGGVSNGNEAAQMILAGAHAVAIGSAVYNRGVEVFQRVNEELLEVLELHEMERLDDLRGGAHE